MGQKNVVFLMFTNYSLSFTKGYTESEMLSKYI